jgi:hypothetical protein
LINNPKTNTNTDVTTAIKWCKGCKNFRCWPEAFGIEKSRATKCIKCRVRQRYKYAITKKKVEDKDEAKKRMEGRRCGGGAS